MARKQYKTTQEDRARNAAYRKANPQLYADHLKNWRNKHPKYSTAQARKWRLEHPDAYQSALGRARKADPVKYRPRRLAKLRINHNLEQYGYFTRDEGYVTFLAFRFALDEICDSKVPLTPDGLIRIAMQYGKGLGITHSSARNFLRMRHLDFLIHIGMLRAS